ncbi:MAG: hypothetical protein EOM15_09025 [Spirochaetia bacterium]|nr:hypothetical protein [Spirochaetia bacterium]
MRNRKSPGLSSDIAFLLIIFFLLLAGISTSQSLTVNLEKETKNGTDTLITKTLELLEDGSLFLDEKAITYADLAKAIAEDTHVSLYIKENTPYQIVVQLLSSLEVANPGSLVLEVLP